MYIACLTRYRSWFLVIALALLAVLTVGIQPIAAQEFGNPDPDQRVYDYAELLTGDELDMLEQRAANVAAAGAPVVVYLRPEDASYNDTLRDARDLMDAWDIQSETDARDGIVIFLNLDPNDLRHGELALVAGKTHFDGGNLPQYELDRITSKMRSLLANEETAEGIGTGLDMLANSLISGPAPPPEPSQFEQVSEDIAGGMLSPLNAIALLVTAALGYLGQRIWRARPTSKVEATLTTTPPDDLIPAAAGALVTGGISDMQMEATILDLAARGSLAIEPEDNKKKAQIRLLDTSVVENRFENEIWKALVAEANEDEIITSKKLSKVRNHWKPAKKALRAGLEDRNWFDPEAGKRARPLYITGVVALLLAAGGLIVSAVSEQAWGFVGTGLLGVVGLSLLVAGFAYRDTTAKGEDQAQPWRGYLKGIKDVRNDWDVDLDLNVVVPYLIAMNAGDTVDKRLKSASEDGFSPLWLGQSHAQHTWGTAGFYPYWITFHAATVPSTSAGAGGGASAGSGGSGGSF